MTPEQAINNFKLLLELSPRNTYQGYRQAVREIAQTCVSLGIADTEPATVKPPTQTIAGGSE